jgi:DNA polymerase V
MNTVVNLFEKHWHGEVIRHIGIDFGGLIVVFSDRGVMVNQEHILFENIRAVVKEK